MSEQAVAYYTALKRPFGIPRTAQSQILMGWWVLAPGSQPAPYGWPAPIACQHMIPCSVLLLHKVVPWHGEIQIFEGSQQPETGWCLNVSCLDGQCVWPQRWPWGTPPNTLGTDQPYSFLQNSTTCQTSAKDVKHTPRAVQFTLGLPWE